MFSTANFSNLLWGYSNAYKFTRAPSLLLSSHRDLHLFQPTREGLWFTQTSLGLCCPTHSSLQASPDLPLHLLHGWHETTPHTGPGEDHFHPVSDHLRYLPLLPSPGWYRSDIRQTWRYEVPFNTPSLRFYHTLATFPGSPWTSRGESLGTQLDHHTTWA